MVRTQLVFLHKGVSKSQVLVLRINRVGEVHEDGLAATVATQLDSAESKELVLLFVSQKMKMDLRSIPHRVHFHQMKSVAAVRLYDCTHTTSRHCE